jgi:hypothetical protein
VKATWLGPAGVLVVAAASTFVAFRSVAGLPAWCWVPSLALAPLRALLSGRQLARLARDRTPTVVPLRAVREGARVAVRGRVLGTKRRTPGVRTPSLAHRVQYLDGRQESVGEPVEWASLVRVVLSDGSDLPLDGGVRIEWFHAKSRAVLREDPEAAELTWPAETAAVAVVSWIPSGAPVVVAGRARAEARATEWTGYRDQAQGFRLEADAEGGPVLYPLAGRARRRAIALGTSLLVAALAAATPFWTLAILRAR